MKKMEMAMFVTRLLIYWCNCVFFNFFNFAIYCDIKRCLKFNSGALKKKIHNVIINFLNLLKVTAPKKLPPLQFCRPELSLAANLAFPRQKLDEAIFFIFYLLS